jgi:diadenosine tetraphosphate (Ap4A) HIT family hydrolase
MSCIFCQINLKELKAHSIYKGHSCHAILDKFPLSEGHVLVLSKTHVGSVEKLPEAEFTEMWTVAKSVSKAMKSLDSTIKDVHFLINDGPSANQHIPHVHIHIIPRYGWDLGWLPVRFMTRFINPGNYFMKEAKRSKWAGALSEFMSDR